MIANAKATVNFIDPGTYSIHVDVDMRHSA
jgi:hypothetical protein